MTIEGRLTKELAEGASLEIEWVLGDVIPAGGIVSLFGVTGAGKSTLALQWALDIAEMQPVLYLDYEMSIELAGRRMQQFDRTDILDGNLVYIVPAGSYIDPLDTEEGSEGLAELLAATGARVVFIDALAATISGGESDNDTFNRFASHTLNKLRERSITTVLVDHISFKDEGGKWPRGATRKLEHLDLGWSMHRLEGSSAFSLKIRKNRIGVDPRATIGYTYEASPMRIRRTDRISFVVLPPEMQSAVETLLEDGFDPYQSNARSVAADRLRELVGHAFSNERMGTILEAMRQDMGGRPDPM